MQMLIIAKNIPKILFFIINVFVTLFMLILKVIIVDKAIYTLLTILTCRNLNIGGHLAYIFVFMLLKINWFIIGFNIMSKVH